MFQALSRTTLLRIVAAAGVAAFALGVAACGGVPDAASSVAIAASSYSVAQTEGSVTLSVVRTGSATGAVSVSYSSADGTAVSGTDYTAVSGTLQWAENDSTPKTISVPVSDATEFSGSKSFQITLTGPSGTTIGNPGSAEVTITGAITPVAQTLVLGNSTYAIAQGAGPLTVTVNRTGGSSGAVSVAYATADGTALAGTDYTAASGTLNWADGDASSKSFTVTISNAVPFTGTKTFSVQLSNASGAGIGTPSSAIVTIGGNASAPIGTLQFKASSYSVAQSAGSATVTVTRDGGSNGAISVAYATSNGTAVAGTNYTATSGTLSWANGDATAKTFTVAVSTATAFSGVKTFTVSLSNPSTGAEISSPGSATVAISGDGSAPVGNVQLSESSYSVSQGAGSVTVTVDRLNGSSGAISVAYATANGSAVAGTDYTAASGTLSWAAGDAAAKSFSVPVSNAAPFSGTKSFTVTLSKPSGGTAITNPATATVSIAGDAVAATPGSLQLSATGYSVAQSGGSVTITVNRTGGSSGAVSVTYATANGTAIAGSAYTAASGTLSWASGSAASKTFTVTVSNATPFSGSEAFSVTLSDPTGGATLSTPSTATVTISGSSTAPSGSTLWVYYDGVFNWGGDWSFAASANYKDTSGVPIEGPYDIEITGQQYGGWQPYVSANCQSSIASCFITTSYKYLVFSAKPTVANQIFGSAVLSAGDTPDGNFLQDLSAYCSGGSNPPVGQWESCKVPLSAYSLTDLTILKFSISDQTGLSSNHYYLDNVGFTTD
jgi:hypothetical protein